MNELTLLGQVFRDRLGVRWRVIKNEGNYVTVRAIAGNSEVRIKTSTLIKKFTKLS